MTELRIYVYIYIHTDSGDISSMQTSQTKFLERVCLDCFWYSVAWWLYPNLWCVYMYIITFENKLQDREKGPVFIFFVCFQNSFADASSSTRKKMYILYISHKEHILLYISLKIIQSVASKVSYVFSCQILYYVYFQVVLVVDPCVLKGEVRLMGIYIQMK